MSGESKDKAARQRGESAKDRDTRLAAALPKVISNDLAMTSIFDVIAPEAYREMFQPYHKAVTDAVDAVLIPSAQNGELKSALQGAQPLFLKHLEHARSVQSGQSDSMAH